MKGVAGVIIVIVAIVVIVIVALPCPSRRRRLLLLHLLPLRHLQVPFRERHAARDALDRSPPDVRTAFPPPRVPIKVVPVKWVYRHVSPLRMEEAVHGHGIHDQAHAHAGADGHVRQGRQWLLPSPPARLDPPIDDHGASICGGDTGVRILRAPAR